MLLPDCFPLAIWSNKAPQVRLKKKQVQVRLEISKMIFFVEPHTGALFRAGPPDTKA